MRETVSSVRPLWLLLILFSAINGNTVETYLNQAAQAAKEKNGSKALEILQHAYKLAPENSNVLSQLATIHYLLHEFDTATTYFEKLVQRNPENVIRFNLGTAYCKLGQFSKAIQQYELLYKKLPKEPALKGALLKLYARNKQWRKTEAIVQPTLWWFDQNIYGKKILLDLDKDGNGLGDGIQFVRYAKYLTQAGAHVIVKAHKPLVPLLTMSPYIAQVISKEMPTPEYDTEYGICIVSLMCKSKNRIAMNLKEEPYLYAQPQLISLWADKLSSDANLKVGLCWQSNFVRHSFTGQIVPSPRSVSLNTLQSIALPGISFYSLQKETNLTDAPMKITQFTDDFDKSHGRFMDTAALIMNCDLIITVDTSIAHLAGALGKPTWLLLNCESDYRWFTDTDQCYWYPSMKLFRQTEFGNWQPVINQIKKELQSLLSNRK